MKKLHSLAFYAMVTPAIALGSTAVLAQQSSDSGVTGESEPSQQSYNSENSAGAGLKNDDKELGQSGMDGQSRMDGEEYMSAAPANGMQASNLIGADVKTTDDEEVGSISDLIIDQDGQVVAIVVGVGGFLGMGEKEVAISWDKVTKSGTADEQELRINQTRDGLRDAPEYEKQD